MNKLLKISSLTFISVLVCSMFFHALNVSFRMQDWNWGAVADIMLILLGCVLVTFLTGFLSKRSRTLKN